MKYIVIAAAVMGALALAPSASLGQRRAAAEIESRQANFKQLGAAYKAVNDELRKGSPNRRVVAANAARMNELSRQLPSWFPSGSGPESGAKTGARTQVWSDAEGFAAAARALQAQTAQLQQVSQAELAVVRTQARAIGGSCKGCHDKFRIEN